MNKYYVKDVASFLHSDFHDFRDSVKVDLIEDPKELILLEVMVLNALSKAAQALSK